MSRRLAFQPDLIDSVLEERIMTDASQYVGALVLMPSGYILFSTPSNFSSSFGAFGPSGNVGSNGAGMAAGFYITGFGLSVMMIGNSSGYPGLSPGTQAGSTSGGSAPANVSTIVGSNASGSVFPTTVASNPFGQSLPLNPGSGFRYIGQPSGSGGALGMSAGANQNVPPRSNVPVDPVAPMGPLVPLAPSQIRPSGSSAEWTPSGPGMPAPTNGVPALSGTLPTLPNVTPALSGTLPTLQGTLPTLNPGRSR
jgi:hypothetical protein